MSIGCQDAELHISIFYSGQILPSGNPLTRVLTASALRDLDPVIPVCAFPFRLSSMIPRAPLQTHQQGAATPEQAPAGKPALPEQQDPTSSPLVYSTQSTDSHFSAGGRAGCSGCSGHGKQQGRAQMFKGSRRRADVAQRMPPTTALHVSVCVGTQDAPKVPHPRGCGGTPWQKRMASLGPSWAHPAAQGSLCP